MVTTNNTGFDGSWKTPFRFFFFFSIQMKKVSLIYTLELAAVLYTSCTPRPATHQGIYFFYNAPIQGLGGEAGGLWVKI